VFVNGYVMCVCVCVWECPQLTPLRDASCYLKTDRHRLCTSALLHSQFWVKRSGRVLKRLRFSPKHAFSHSNLFFKSFQYKAWGLETIPQCFVLCSRLYNIAAACSFRLRLTFAGQGKFGIGNRGCFGGFHAPHEPISFQESYLTSPPIVLLPHSAIIQFN